MYGWKNFTGSEEQIKEIVNAAHGFMLDSGCYQECIFKVEGEALKIFDKKGECFSATKSLYIVDVLQEIAPVRFLILQPNPYVYMN
jgi:hypothetical protein